MQVLVRSLTLEAEDIVALELVARDGSVLPPFTAGAHVDLHLPNRLLRSYSLANAPGDSGRYVVAVNKDPASRGGSRYIHEKLRPGELIEISEPRNNFPLREDVDHVVLFAGGIGITPLWCMIQRLEAIGRSWELFYGSRSRAKCAYLQPLLVLEAAKPGRVHLHFDAECNGAPMDMGRIIAGVAPDAHLYCCGPTPMLSAYEQASATRDPATVHAEYFSAKSEAALDGGYSVVLTRAGRKLDVAPGKSILDALLEAGIEVSYSCMQGVCGACEVRIIEGEADHRDSVLTTQEQEAGKTMMICCSGSKSACLVLDL
ncbi:MAG: 2Fe-2S iron-sulfur cluster-binding protein [Burkholderiaceae bacterium]